VVVTEETKHPKWQVVDNALSATLTEQYGFLPLSVRYDAAEAARRVVDAWREDLEGPSGAGATAQVVEKEGP
jgi:hypothetical protein